MPTELCVLLLIYIAGAMLTFLIFLVVLLKALKEPDPYDNPDDWREWRSMMEESNEESRGYIFTGCICSVFLAIFWPGIPIICLINFIEEHLLKRR